MDYNARSECFSSYPPILHSHHYRPDEVLQISSGNEQNYERGRLSAGPKIEVDDDTWGAKCNASSKAASHSAQAAIKRQIKKERRNKRTADDVKFESKWRGLRQEELESKRYLHYRENQRKRAKDRSNEEDVWPDNYEYAFQLALRIVPPRGRKKETVVYPEGYVELALRVDPKFKEHESGSKLCGRNELISHAIYKWLGGYRSRKQVSSHIQVLKNFMVGQRNWLQHVNVEDTTEMRVALQHQVHLHNLALDDLGDDDFRSLVQNPLGAKVSSSALICPPPNAILGSNVPGQRPVLNRIEFEMYVLSPSPEEERIHDYTSHQAETGATPWALEEVSNWRTLFPLLEDYYERSMLASDIILIDSNINLLAEYPPTKSRLSIRFRVNIAGAADNAQWSTTANYYENNGQPIDMEHFYATKRRSRTSAWGTTTAFRTPGSSDVQLEIPLQSEWWVQLFTDMATHRHGKRQDRHSLQQEEEEEVEDWSRQYLQELSIMQELRVRSGISGTSTKRIAIILWRFSPSRRGQAATTTWRKLKTSPQRWEVNSPAPSPEPPLQPSMDLDRSIHTIAMPRPVFAHAERFLHHSDIFVKDSERVVGGSQPAEDSPSPALSPSYTTSFPSSTTTSFPPSVTQGYLSHEESHEPACYSQDSHSYRHESFASQNSFDFSQKLNYAYQESRGYVEDLNHLSGNLELESQDPAYYSQQSLDTIADFHSSAEYDDQFCHDGLNHHGPRAMHDFSGGEIQLSFQTQHLPPNAHPLPYIAPSTNLLQLGGPAQEGGDINDHGLHQVNHDFSPLHNESEMMAASISQHPDLDFSAWEAHFTTEDLAALRSQNGEPTAHDEVHRTHTETHLIDSHHDHVHTAGDWTFVRTSKHSHLTPVEQPDHGSILGEVGIADEEVVEQEDGQAAGAGDDFDFEEIYGPGSQVGESQAAEVQEQEQDIDHGRGQDYSSDDFHGHNLPG